MIASDDKRGDQRFSCKVPIVVSCFNSKHTTHALLVDHCMNGVGFVSEYAFLKGTAIVIRIAHYSMKDSCVGDLEILPSIRMGEVKWCRNLPGEITTTYEVGAKYYPQVY